MLTEYFHCSAHKLLQLDGESSNFLSPGSDHRSVDEQLAAHQHRCEEWARTQVKQEVSRGGEGVERGEQGRGLGVGRVNRKGVGSDV